MSLWCHRKNNIPALFPIYRDRRVPGRNLFRRPELASEVALLSFVEIRPGWIEPQNGLRVSRLRNVREAAEIASFEVRLTAGSAIPVTGAYVLRGYGLRSLLDATRSASFDESTL
jgi:hypothetical protein